MSLIHYADTLGCTHIEVAQCLLSLSLHAGRGDGMEIAGQICKQDTVGIKSPQKNSFLKNLIFFFWMDGLDGKTYYYLTNRKIME